MKFGSDLKLLFSIFSTSQSKRFSILIFMIVCGAFLETFGISLLLPLLAIISNPQALENNNLYHQVTIILGTSDQRTLVLAAVCTFALVNSLRIGFTAILSFKQTTFIKDFIVGLSEKLYWKYLNKSYAFHLQQNSAQLIRNMTGEVSITAQLVQNFLTLFSEMMVLIGFAVLLLLVEPVGVMVVISLLGAAAWAFHHITRLHVRKWGNQREYHEGMRLQQLQGGLGGVKEIKLLGIESLILQGYAPYNRGSAHSFQRNTFIQALPRLWLELLVILGMGIFLLLGLWQGRPLSGFMPVLGLFGAAAFRLMPSVNRILGAVQGIHYSSPALQNLATEVGEASDEPLFTSKSTVSQRSLAFSDRIMLKNISFTYPASHQRALNEINLTIKKGMSVGFIGGSGAGKSTLIDVLLGLLSLEGGQILVDGKNIDNQLKWWQSQLGYVPQTIYLTDETLRRNIAFGLVDEDIDHKAVLRALRLAQLEEFVATLPDGLDTMVGERGVRLSGGQRQRVGIARALYYDPPILLLDEATSALDNSTEKAVMEAVDALHGDKTLLIVAHRLSTVANCDVVYRLENGQVVAFGHPEEITHQ